MAVEQIDRGGVVVLYFTETAWDTFTTIALGQKLQSIYELKPVPPAVVNLRGLTFVSADGAVALVHAHRNHLTRNARLLLCCMSEELRRLYRQTRMEKGLYIFDTEDGALQEAQSLLT